MGSQKIKPFTSVRSKRVSGRPVDRADVELEKRTLARSGARSAAFVDKGLSKRGKEKACSTNAFRLKSKKTQEVLGKSTEGREFKVRRGGKIASNMLDGVPLIKDSQVVKEIGGLG